MSARELNGLGADVAFGQATLETLARFSVMSRLRKHENSTLFAKMRVYDGESLKDSDPKARSVEESKDAAGVDEGMDGVSTRFAFKILAATYNHDTAELGADLCTSIRSAVSSFLRKSKSGTLNSSRPSSCRVCGIHWPRDPESLSGILFGLRS